MFDAVYLMGGLGLIIGLALAVASKIFYVYVDPKILAVEEALPGANCGGCGLPGCSANAEAIVTGLSAPNSCVAANPEVIEAIAKIMGVTVEATEPDFARPGCYFGVADADQKYVYNGLDDCRAVALLGGGMKVCSIGCLGLGTCARACPFGAITMGPKGLPVVNEGRCTGCGTCERVCPKHIINLSSTTRRIIREYTTEECTTPCQRSCPAGINIREYIRQISLGDYHHAVQVIKERNPFPAVIGRICPRPCELNCRRNFVDEPVAINYLKRYAADYEKQSGQRIQPYHAPATGRRVAVVGGGVEGLSTAFFTARLGHATTVYEATSQLGGLLRTAIARERLPQDILDWDIAGVLDMGVTAKTGQLLGQDFTIESLLQEGFDAVFLALGGWDSRLARGGQKKIETPIPGTCLLVDFLQQPCGPIPCGLQTVILGGGKLALDAAERCLSSGAQQVTVLFRETWENSPITEADLPDGGVSVIHQAAVSRLVGEGGQLTGVECVDLGSGSRSVFACQTLIIATGRFPELIVTALRTATSEDESSQTSAESGWQAVTPYKPTIFKEELGLFAEGDVLADYGAAIKAIGAGRRAAATIHQIMHGLSPRLTEHVIAVDSYLQDVDHVERVQASPRTIMPLCRGKELVVCGEVERGFSEEAARAEATRCLQCGLICYERLPEHRAAESSLANA
jgi:formate dehydrogenase beta subunit